MNTTVVHYRISDYNGRGRSHVSTDQNLALRCWLAGKTVRFAVYQRLAGKRVRVSKWQKFPRALVAAGSLVVAPDNRGIDPASRMS